MDTKDKREWMSALADGQLQGEDFARGVEMAGDPQALDAWRSYHLIGDVLRSPGLAAGTPSADFLARLQVRIAAEAPRAQAQAAAPQPIVVREAANDHAFRWKLVAGFASLAAVGAIGWNVVTGAGAERRGAELAAAPASAPGNTVVVGSARGPVVRDARLDELLAAHRQLAATTAPQDFLRNATYDTSGR